MHGTAVDAVEVSAGQDVAFSCSTTNDDVSELTVSLS